MPCQSISSQFYTVAAEKNGIIVASDTKVQYNFMNFEDI